MSILTTFMSAIGNLKDGAVQLLMLGGPVEQEEEEKNTWIVPFNAQAHRDLPDDDSVQEQIESVKEAFRREGLAKELSLLQSEVFPGIRTCCDDHLYEGNYEEILGRLKEVFTSLTEAPAASDEKKRDDSPCAKDGYEDSWDYLKELIAQLEAIQNFGPNEVPESIMVAGRMRIVASRRIMEPLKKDLKAPVGELVKARDKELEDLQKKYREAVARYDGALRELITAHTDPLIIEEGRRLGWDEIERGGRVRFITGGDEWTVNTDVAPQALVTYEEQLKLTDWSSPH